MNALISSGVGLNKELGREFRLDRLELLRNRRLSLDFYARVMTRTRRQGRGEAKAGRK